MARLSLKHFNGQPMFYFADNGPVIWGQLCACASQAAPSPTILSKTQTFGSNSESAGPGWFTRLITE